MEDTKPIKLREKFTTGDWTNNPGEYTLLDRTDKKAIYEIKDEGFTHYEVFRVYTQKDFNGVLREKYPSDEKFGQTAWCYRDKNKAINKYNSLKS